MQRVEAAQTIVQYIADYFLFVAFRAHAITAPINITTAILTTMADLPSLEKSAGELSSFLERWNRIHVWTLAVALIAGTISFFSQRQLIEGANKLDKTKDQISRLKEEQLTRDLKNKEEKIAKLDEARSQAEKETAALRHDVIMHSVPRWAKIVGTLGEWVAKAPPGSVEVIFAPNDDEAHRAAMNIEMELSAAGKWTITRRTSPASDDRPELILPLFSNNPFNSPLMTRMGLLTAITIVASPSDLGSAGSALPREGTALHALVKGLQACGLPSLWNIDPRLLSGTVRVLVGTKE